MGFRSNLIDTNILGMDKRAESEKSVLEALIAAWQKLLKHRTAQNLDSRKRLLNCSHLGTFDY